ncbi:MAG: flagellar biosynthetic protein FliO [Fimbriimonadaceae bacterium]
MNLYFATLAQSLGTKSDMAVSSPATGGTAWVPVIVILAALALGARWIVRKGIHGTARPGSQLLVKETATLGAGQVAIVEARGKTCLVGVTANSLTFLTELPTDTPPEAFLDVLDQVEPNVQGDPAAQARWERLQLQ